MTDLLCVSHLRWDFVWQRPQHLISRLAKDYRIWFIEEPVSSTEVSSPCLEVFPAQGVRQGQVMVVRLIQPVTTNRWIGHGDPLTQSSYSRLLQRYLKSEGVRQPVLWLYTPMASDFAAAIPHRLLVYDVMDQLSAFKGAPPEIVEREQSLLPKADIVFTGGISLYRSKLAHNPHTYLFPSGVEIAHYARAAKRDAFECPSDLASVQGPLLGYFGVIDERMDLDLLSFIAHSHPDWNIVLVGPVVKISASELPQAPNLYYPGKRNYEQLPAYLAYFDVALIPFAMNEATLYLSPTKTLEYMAAHKPIVSTPIRDVVELYGEVVRIAATPADYVRQIEAALVDDSPARYVKEKALLVQHTWDNIVQRMHERLLARLNPLSVAANSVTSESSASQVLPLTG